MSQAIEIILLEIGIVLFFSMLLGAALRKLKLSPIIGYILGGIILGLLEIVSKGPESTLILKLFSELGVLMILFFIGLELETKTLRKGGLIPFILGPTKIILCFAFGAVIGLWLGFSLIESALFGVVASISSTAIIGKYLLDNNLTKSLETGITIPALLIEDFYAVVVLVILGTLVSDATHAGGGIESVLLTGVFFVIVAIFILSEFSRYLIELIEKFDYAKHIAFYSLGIALAFAVLASFFGLEPAIGAFLAGFLLSELKEVKK
ncbi:MAG: cation:proton antiporter, partial [Candidatus Diapherotrites archaeon]